jgi:L-fuconolactonase
MRIDAHLHFWKTAFPYYEWLPQDDPTYSRDYLPEDSEQMLRSNSIEGAIVVQAASDVEETRFLLRLAEDRPDIFGVVGWLDLESNSWERTLEQFRRNTKFAGIRISESQLFDDNGQPRSNLRTNLSKLADVKVPVDLLLTTKRLQPISELLHAIPHLRTVLNHLGFSPHSFDRWANTITEYAQLEGTMCKISGMITQARGLSISEIGRYVKHVVQVFSPERVMFGSDWPICLKGGSYDEVVRLFEHTLPAGLAEREIDLIRGSNALHFYQIGAS